MTLQHMNMVMGSQGSFSTSPIRFVDFTLEVSGINKDYGSDFTMSFKFHSTNSAINIAKDGGAGSPAGTGAWTIGGAGYPIGPDMPQWHEDYPVTDPGLYDMAYISTTSLTGGAGVDDIKWAGWTNPDSRAPDWERPSNSFALASIVENPGGIAHTTEWVAVYHVRRISDSVVMAEATVTMRAIFT